MELFIFMNKNCSLNFIFVFVAKLTNFVGFSLRIKVIDEHINLKNEKRSRKTHIYI